MFLTYYQDTKYYEYLNYGGAHTLESYYASSSDKKVPYSHLRFLVSTKLFYEVNDYVFVHGGLPPTMTIAEALADTEIYSSFLWQREHLETEQNNWEKTVVFGHTPVREPIQRNNMIRIDTGCVYKQFGKLTALILPEIEFIQQLAEQLTIGISQASLFEQLQTQKIAQAARKMACFPLF